MTESTFTQYHNFHIKFKVNNGKESSGVFLERNNVPNDPKPRTVYKFIPTNNMIEWKQAKEKKDFVTVERLQSEIDISNITWAERLYY